MKLLFKKAMCDLFGNRSRLLTAFFAILLGTVVFISVTFSYFMIEKEINHVFSETNPASATIVVDNLDENLLELTQNFDGITDYDIKAFYELRMEKPDGKTKTLLLFSAPDFADTSINKLKPLEGSFSPNLDEVLLEQDALSVASEKLGGTLPILLPDGSIQNYRIAGTLNDLSQHPPSMHNQVYAYVSENTLESMGLSMNKIDFFVNGSQYDRENILEITSEYISLLEQNGYRVLMVDISNTPGVSMHLAEYRGALFIFQVFSVLAFLFGCIIMSSLLSTILAGQVKQIGILKSIGAKTGKIMVSYIAAALLLITINLVVSIPLSILVSRGLSSFLMSLGNMHMSAFSVSAYLYAVISVITLILPLFLAIIPIRRGLSITIKDALNDTGTDTKSNKKGFAFPNWISAKISRPTLLSLRAATQHKRRFFTNLFMLILGGVLFVGIMASIVSINTTLGKNMNTMNYDYQISTSSYSDSEKAQEIASEIDTVIAYECWGAASGKLVYENGSIGNLFTFMAPSYDTDMFHPELMKGRWLQEGDTNAIVVSFEFLGWESDYILGDEISFHFGDTQQQFVIVGIIKEIGVNSIYMDQAGFEQLIPENIQKMNIKLETIEQRNKRNLYHNIENTFAEQGLSVVASESKAEQYKILKAHFTTTLVSFLTVAIMAIFVAGFGLASTMSLQVAERTKEIGIMKSIGASTKKIRKIVTAESYFVSLCAFAVSAVLSIPVTFLAVYVIGVYVLEIPLAVPVAAVLLSLLIWFVLTLFVGRMASRAAAKKAEKLTVKTALMFE